MSEREKKEIPLPAAFSFKVWKLHLSRRNVDDPLCVCHNVQHAQKSREKHREGGGKRRATKGVLQQKHKPTQSSSSGLATCNSLLATCNVQLDSLLLAPCHVLQVPLTRRACSASYADPSLGESWTCATWPQRAALAKYPAALPQQQQQLLPRLQLHLLHLLLFLQLLWRQQWRPAAYSGTSWQCHSVQSWQTIDATCCPLHGDRCCCQRQRDDRDARDGSDAGDAPSTCRSRQKNCNRRRVREREREKRK